MGKILEFIHCIFRTVFDEWISFETSKIRSQVSGGLSNETKETNETKKCAPFQAETPIGRGEITTKTWLISR